MRIRSILSFRFITAIIIAGLIISSFAMMTPPGQVKAQTGKPPDPLQKATNGSQPIETGEIVYPHIFQKSLLDLPQTPEAQVAREIPHFDWVNPEAAQSPETGSDPAIQPESSQTMMPPITASFDGLSLDPWGAGWPPDANGEVGLKHYIEAVNTSFGVFDKTGTLLAASTFDDFFDGTDTPCDDSNKGAPVVLYDHLANRWLVTDYAWRDIDNGPYYQCIAVSITDDPVSGGWYIYAYQAHSAYLHDYPKLAVWPDGYYMSANLFDVSGGGATGAYMGVRVWALNRNDLLTGSPLHSIYADIGTSYYSLLPSNLEGPTPPFGSPNYFASLYDGVTDYILVWKFKADWLNPGDSAFSGPTYTSVTSFNSALNCGASGRDCIPQLGGPSLDAMSGRPMMQLQYRNFGAYESLWLNHTIDLNTSFDIAGIRWYELRNLGSASPTVYQSGNLGTVLDGLERWMGSLAVDHIGNMALGYSASNASSYTSIRYAGRLVTDTTGTLGQAESTFHASTGAQTTYNRWGGYSAMSVDPEDDCTFWYVNQYYAATGTNWQTRIGSFRYPSCTSVKYWDGANTRWDQASNWSPSGVPTASDTIVIDTSLSPNAWPTLNTNGEVYNITIGNGGRLNVTANNTLTVHGNWQQNGSGSINATAGSVILRGDTLSLNMGTPGTSNHFYNLQIGNTASAPLVTLRSSLRVDGNFTSVVGSVFNAGGYTLELHGNLDFQGQFNPESSTARFTTAVARTARQLNTAIPLLSQNFESWPLPAGWSVINNVGTCGWRTSTDVNTQTDLNATGSAGNYADADSDDCGSGTSMDTELRTPVLDLTQAPAAFMQFKSDMRFYAADQWDVDLSLDGGSTWPTNLLHRQGQNYRGPETITLDLSAAAGQSNVRIRFRYRGSYDYWWQVDEVRVYGFTGPLTLYNLQLTAGTTTLGSDVVVQNYVDIDPGATLNLNAYHLSVGGNLTNDGSYTINSGFTRNNDIATFDGAALQTIGGASANTFNHVTIDNPAGITLSQNQTINGMLTLTQGLLTLGGQTLTLGPSATIGGTPSAVSMIVPTGAGQLRKQLTGIASFTFPIGDNTGSAEYSPVTLDFTSGTFNSAYVALRLADEKHPANPSSTDYLTRWWEVTQNGISNFSCDVRFTYLPSDVIGIETNIGGMKFDGSNWTFLEVADAVTHRFSGTVASFSQFTGGKAQPTAATLSDFQAVSANGKVLVQWTTTLEIDTVGFNIYRSTGPDGERTLLNPMLIQPVGMGSVGGAAYEFTDETARPGVLYYYWLEVVSISGLNIFGPATAQTGFVLFLPIGIR